MPTLLIVEGLEDIKLLLPTPHDHLVSLFKIYSIYFPNKQVIFRPSGPLNKLLEHQNDLWRNTLVLNAKMAP